MGKQKYFTEEERKIAYKEYQRKYQRKYRKIHKKKLIEYYKEYRKNHKFILTLKQKQQIKKWQKEHKIEIKTWRRNYTNIKLKTDINFKMAHYLRNRLRISLHQNQKSGSAVEDLGCSISDLKVYLESKFQDGMNWNNWGINGWHIDHIRPLSSFDLTNRDEFLKACHYTNLQPMWAKENWDKGTSLS
ncbi:MAG: hypothetical protein WC495_06515 [Patescibacteria group bacterium]|jgi:hypothetical protein